MCDVTSRQVKTGMPPEPQMPLLDSRSLVTKPRIARACERGGRFDGQLFHDEPASSDDREETQLGQGRDPVVQALLFDDLSVLQTQQSSR
jgi:hypothetical protein